MQSRSTPEQTPATPPMSVMSTSSSAVRRNSESLESSSSGSISTPVRVSVISAFIIALFVQERITPRLSPQTPPTLCSPSMLPAEAQFSIMPSSVLTPAIPPTQTRQETSPSNEQPEIVPWFTAAIPPTDEASSVGAMLPETLRSFITAPASTVRMKPAEPNLPPTSSPEIV